MMKGENERHPGLTAALQSMSKNRSPTNAYILLLGTTGSGKSSAVIKKNMHQYTIKYTIFNIIKL
jgi:Cdc6-like AAA superfamily ATPase